MLGYYTAIIFLSIFSMLAMLVCVNSSGTLTRNKKRLFRMLFISVIIAAFGEWFGFCLQGTGELTRIVHIFVKAMELSVAPSIGFLIAWVIDNKDKKGAAIFLITHAVIEYSSGIFGFIYKVDINSNYSHADFYWIYIAAYTISILYGIYVIIRNIKKYQYSGIGFFILITVFLLTGVAMQLYNSDLKVDYIALAIASIMLYVFMLEMIQQTDELTGLINRRGYENYISHIEEKCMILFFDVDSFKIINDKYGHVFGDVCLKTIGNILRINYAKYGKCFRIGGDEFCTIITKNLDDIEVINSAFFQRMEQHRNKESRLPYISIGYVVFNPQVNNIQDAISEADQRMYQYKKEHRNCI